MSEKSELLQMRLQNGETQVYAVNAVWDDKNRQLVACTMASSNKQSIQSILASLSTNSKRFLTLRGAGTYSYSSVYLEGARKGFFKMSKNMSVANAEGWVECIEHPATGDPRLLPDWDYFFVITTPGQDFTKKFVDRLNLAIPWPVLPEWGEYLLENGKSTRLIHDLKMAGPGYERGITVWKREDAWENLISAGVTGGTLSLN
jgi:hypothetical protein